MTAIELGLTLCEEGSEIACAYIESSARFEMFMKLGAIGVILMAVIYGIWVASALVWRYRNRDFF